MATNNTPNEPIAVIGTSCRFPGSASSPSKLWDLLHHPYDLTQKVPASRFNIKSFHHPNGEHHGTTDATKSYFLSEDPTAFDASFFAINAREAEALDPQQRVLLETVYEALENAGMSIDEIAGTPTAVYVGLMCADYYDVLMRDVESLPKYLATGTARSIMANRISYFFDWRGQSMTIDTACSSSLVAVHEALIALRSGQSRTAIAAGANLIFGPEMYVSESNLHMLSPKGRSRMWDSGADGYARGEGTACVVLKTLKNALEDGDVIECIIRETGVNSDGKTQGITMPSATSQAELIRQTYARAGLDCSKASDRCQYFEAHGTGTPAGDPIEAEAIATAFFPDSSAAIDNGKLFVGSVKTVIGHLEGAAGLAGLIKASLAIKNKTIPPNLHFKALNPAIEPFYGNLEIPIAATPWPDLKDGCPLRASVNSFGFGGTNAHCIIESYTPQEPEQREPESIISIPFNFSATTEDSLVQNLEHLSDYLGEHEEVSIIDLAYTLSKRSAFPVKSTFVACTIEELQDQLEKVLIAKEENASTVIGTRVQIASDKSARKLLGVFTGQGAQWPALGKHLILSVDSFRNTIERLEKSLNELSDGPKWSLKDEIMAPAETSQLEKAEFSQPLCTAIQVALVDLLYAAGVNFSSVVGHSSGEIAAAYAAGRISAADAIRIAFYRGKHAHLAGGKSGEEGAMMAVGISFEEAQEFCAGEAYKGKVSIAASNGPKTVTLSGDKLTIEAAKAAFDSKETFARLLKVDTAYHSHHMLPCSEKYLASLRECKIITSLGRSDCTWISSVHVKEIAGESPELAGQYWLENLVSPVLFFQAVTMATKVKGPFDAGLEVGPHPALKGPVTQSIKQACNTNTPLPYSGVLSRGVNDCHAFASAIGFLMSYFGRENVNFPSYLSALTGSSSEYKPTLLKDLPTYCWDHTRSYWAESRLSRNFRTRPDPPHELLGVRCPDDSAHEYRWRNIFKLDEMPWVSGHKFQRQTLVPAALYCSMALEASKVLANGSPIRLVDLQDVDIEKAINLEENNASVEVMFSLKPASLPSKTASEGEIVEAEFWCTAAENGKDMSKIFSGKVAVTLGAPSSDALASRSSVRPVLGPLNVDRFYDSLAHVGLEFSGIFRGLENGQRRMHMSSLEGRRLASDTGVLVHPAFLDMALHATLAAYASPGDERFWTPYLPRRIASMKFNIALCAAAFKKSTLAGMDGYVTRTTPTTATDAATYVGDVDVFDPATGEIEIQIESLQMQSFTVAREVEDRQLYLQTIWESDISCGIVTPSEVGEDDPEALYLIELGEKLTYSYMRQLRADIKNFEIPDHHRPLFNWIDHVLKQVAEDNHPFIQRDWDSNVHSELIAEANKHPHCVDLELMQAVGNNLADVVRGTTTMLEHMLPNGLLDSLYKKGLGMATSNKYVSRAMKKIGHRYPKMKVLEIGAGTGGATKGVLASLGSAFSHYTFTDISTGFFMSAREQFKDYADRMTFSLLNCEKDVVEQGYEEGSFDVIVASNVLHATEFLGKTMSNVRRLLKPGGYLCLLECTGHLERTGFLMAGLSGWWLGGADGRPYRPTISPSEWDTMLKNTGFTGVDSIVNDFKDKSRYTVSVILTQSLDDDVAKLRKPLEIEPVGPQRDLLIVGGASSDIKVLIQNLAKSIPDLKSRKINIVENWEDASALTLPYGITVLSVADLDEPVFQSMTPQRLKGMQAVINSASSILWVTKGCMANEPYANMTIGLGRSIISEMPHLNLQFLDVDSADSHKFIGETLMRLELSVDLEPRKDTLLWSTEPEMILENGQLYIPRVVPLQELNDKLNSNRRAISNEVALASTKVAVVSSSAGDYALKSNGKVFEASDDTVQIKVTHSSLHAVRIGEQYLYVCLGKERASGAQVLTISGSNESLIAASRQQTIKVDYVVEDGVTLVEGILSYLVAKRITDLSAGRSTLVHEPRPLLALALKSLSSGSSVVFSTTGKQEALESSWLTIHPALTKRAVQALIPGTLSSFVSLEGGSQHIKVALPTSCSSPAPEAFLSTKSTSSAVQTSSIAALEAASKFASTSKISTTENSISVDVSDISSRTLTKTSIISVIDWSKTSSISLSVKPIELGVLFDSNKSYLLAGLTGDLGQSICRWMVQHGARFLIIGSRSIKAGAPWQAELERMGATVLVYPIDFTDKAAVFKLRDHVVKNLPPIAGVMNGCMVLDDKPFSDMPFENLQRVLQPKVMSTNNLDEAFGAELDFFVLYSSLAAVNGIPGQSNYAAANMYMTSLAAQRRAAGKAASVLHIGMILGVGYVERSGRFTESALRSYNYLPIPEHEFLLVLSEAVRPHTPHPEIIMGMVAPALDEEREKPRWHANPKFAHVMHEFVSTQLVGDDAEVEASTKEQLAGAGDKDEVNEVLVKCFKKQLRLILQAETVDEALPLTSLGIDSLIAVEIRSWFLKEVGVSLPVLKVLGGASAAELCEIAAGEYKIAA